MKNLVYVLFLSGFSFLNGQSKATVQGVVKDETGKSIPNAEVFLDGTIFSVFTTADGSFQLDVEPGSYELVVSAYGFEEVSNPIQVQEGEKVEISPILKSIENEFTQLNEAIIVAEVRKETEAVLLNAQRKSVLLQENIGAKELERKGVSDVASAVTKVSGISKQEGSSVIYVRGLGDRYNSTTLNGLPIPSNDPEFKNIDLAILPTDILEYIGIEKVYSGAILGDFAGGNINIHTKSHSGRGFFKIGLSSRMNSNAISDANFKLQRGINWMGFDKAENPLSITHFGFENSLNPQKSGALGSGISLTTGNSFKWGSEGKLSFYLLGSFDNDYTSIKEGFAKGGVSAQGVAMKNFQSFDSYSYQTHTNGYLNLSVQANRKNIFKFNSLFVNSSTQKLEEYYGFSRDVITDGLIRRGSFVQDQLWVNQLLGQHRLGEGFDLNWAIGYNTIASDMPDRFQNTLEGSKGFYTVSSANSTSDNNRYFHSLNEDEFVGNLAVDYKFGQVDNSFKGKLTLGYNGRLKERNLEAIQYNFKVNYPYNQLEVNPENLDAFFNSANFQSGYFSISTYGVGIEPQYYNGNQNIHGAYVNFEYKFSPKFTVFLGLRGEYLNQKVDWQTNYGAPGENELNQFEFLPSLIFKYELNPRQNLRFAASKTYTLPQFKERALFAFEEVTETIFGWPSVYASIDYNADFKWEFFPKTGEIISLNAFGKYIENPINKLTIASAANDLSYANTGDWGYVIGVELEIRKNLYHSESTNPFRISGGANVSFAKTKQELNSEKIFEETRLANGSRLNANFTHSESAFQGASDWLLNADLSFHKNWEHGKNLLATLTYNYYSDRIYAIGTEGKGDIVEKGLGTLDFILRTQIIREFGIGIIAKNLLNPTYQRIQENETGDVTVLNYKKGVSFSLGINYQF